MREEKRPLAERLLKHAQVAKWGSTTMRRHTEYNNLCTLAYEVKVLEEQTSACADTLTISRLIKELEVAKASAKANDEGWEDAHSDSVHWIHKFTVAKSCLETLRKRHDAEVASFNALLCVARCPNDGCKDGVIPVGPDPDGFWEAEQCQWCDERASLIKAISSTVNASSIIDIPDK